MTFACSPSVLITLSVTSIARLSGQDFQTHTSNLDACSAEVALGLRVIIANVIYMLLSHIEEVTCSDKLQ